MRSLLLVLSAFMAGIGGAVLPLWRRWGDVPPDAILLLDELHIVAVGIFLAVVALHFRK